MIIINKENAFPFYLYNIKLASRNETLEVGNAQDSFPTNKLPRKRHGLLHQRKDHIKSVKLELPGYQVCDRSMGGKWSERWCGRIQM